MVVGMMAIDIPKSHAIVCARGVVRAGYAGAGGAVVAPRPVAACRWVVVNGVRVRRCV